MCEKSNATIPRYNPNNLCDMDVWTLEKLCQKRTEDMFASTEHVLHERTLPQPKKSPYGGRLNMQNHP